MLALRKCTANADNFPRFEGGAPPKTHPIILASRLHRLKNGLLELTLNLLARLVGGGLAVEGEEVAEVELGGLEELDLADVDLK